MLDFRPICLEDRAWIEPVMQAAAGHGSEFSFVNLFLWGDQRVASVDGTPVFLSNFSGSLTYPWPVGCRALPGPLELLRQDACERGIPLRLFGLLPEERRVTGILPMLSVKDNTLVSAYKRYVKNKLHIISPKKLEAPVNEVSKKLDVRAASNQVQIKYLSGGNQQKVIVGRWLLEPANVQLHDAPPRGVDVGAKNEI